MSLLLEREGSEFATFGEYAVEYRDASHRYWLIRGQERIPAISVTAALKVLDKPALVSWAERMGVEGALRLERAGALQDIAVEDALGVVRREGAGADAKRDAGADRGSALHAALRSYCEVGEVPKIGDFDPEVRGYVQGLCRWLLATRPTPILVEQIVGSALHGYAGRFDLLAEINGRNVLVDLKTSARPYAEQHLQIAAYMHALQECEGEEPKHFADDGLVLLAGADGTFSTHQRLADAKHFLTVLACHRAVRKVQAAVRSAEKAAEAVAA